MKKVMSLGLSVAVLVVFASTSVLASGYDKKGSMTEGAVMEHGSEKGVAIHGYCPVCVVESKSMVKGVPQFTTQYEGKVYRFPAIEQQKMFLDNPAKYTADLEAQFDALKTMDKDMKKDKKGSTHHDMKGSKMK